MSSEEKIVGELKSATQAFNNFYQRWVEEHGCHANFVFTYDKTKGKQLEVEYVKSMEVSTIDKPIYRRDAASDKSVHDALAAAKVKKPQ